MSRPFENGEQSVNPITFPLQAGMQDAAVADLQDTLLLLIDIKLF